MYITLAIYDRLQPKVFPKGLWKIGYYLILLPIPGAMKAWKVNGLDQCNLTDLNDKCASHAFSMADVLDFHPAESCLV